MLGGPSEMLHRGRWGRREGGGGRREEGTKGSTLL